MYSLAIHTIILYVIDVVELGGAQAHQFIYYHIYTESNSQDVS